VIGKGGGAIGSSALAEAAETAEATPRRFVAGFLGSFLAVLAAVLAFNIAVDPLALAGTGLVPTAVEPDRSIKLDLLQHLKHGPQILILGDSRGRQAQPSQLERLTGRTAFNAAVTGGSAPEAYVFVRYTADRFPRQKRRYIWFTDNGLASGIVQPQLAQDPRARRYLSGIPGFGLGDVKTYLSTDATRDSWRVFEKCVLAACHSRIQYDADGSLTKQSLRFLPEDAKSLRRSVRARIALVKAHPETFRQARRDLEDPQRFAYMERMLAFMNRRGEVPVIVLNPIYPSVFAVQRRMGFPELRATLWKLAQLRKLGFRFVLVNCEDIRAWHGTAYDWSNASHVNRANMRRELRYIVAHSDGVLR
ncbi:MAG TPA: hypothetical protein VFL58_09645, partial [Gaiellaceae bacterium]|nr:hypothetical protein [Gaiellaceae bacterium]